MFDKISFALQVVGTLAVLVATITSGLFIFRTREESWDWGSGHGLLTIAQFAIFALFILCLIVGDPLKQQPSDLQPDWNFQD